MKQHSPKFTLWDYTRFYIFGRVPKTWKLLKPGMFYDEYVDTNSNRSVIVEKKEGRILWR